MLPDKRSLGAFLKVPFVAAGAWYLCELGSLWGVNGHLRLRPDVLAFGIGTVIIGIPVAFVATFGLALPAYSLCRKLGQVHRKAAVLGGLAVGLALALVAVAIDDTAVMQWWIGAAVGSFSGYAWWRLAGRPGLTSSS